jgi:hypothetical protein
MHSTTVYLLLMYQLEIKLKQLEIELLLIAKDLIL